MDCGAYGGEQIFLTTMTAHTLSGNYRLGSVRLVSRADLHQHRAERRLPGLQRRLQHVRARTAHRRDLRATRHGSPASSAAATCSATATSARRVRSSKATSWVRCSSAWRRCASSARSRRGATGASTAAPPPSAPGSSSSARRPRRSTSTPTAARRSSPPASRSAPARIVQALPQIVADRLGMRPEDVVVRAADTDAGGYDIGRRRRADDRLARRGERAAGDEVRRKLLDVAADMLEASPEDLESGGRAREIVVGAPSSRRHRCSRSSRTRTRRRVRSRGPASFTAPGTGAMPGCAAGHFIEAIDMPVFAVHECDVAVDPDTGHVEVLELPRRAGRRPRAQPARHPRADPGRGRAGPGLRAARGADDRRPGRLAQNGFETYRRAARAATRPGARSTSTKARRRSVRWAPRARARSRSSTWGRRSPARSRTRRESASRSCR